MPPKKILKNLIKKFKWPLFGLIILASLVNYLTFLIRFNLRTNLYHWKYGGKFYFLFGKISTTEKTNNGQIFVDWNKLLLILFLLYFPLKIIIQFTLEYFQKLSERKARVYLSKSLLNFATENRDLITVNSSEKIYIINHKIPELTRQFFSIPISLFSAFSVLGLEIFAFVFLIRNNNLSELVPLIISFLFVNLVWLVFFNRFTQKANRLEKKKRKKYQKEEETKIKIFLENLNSDSKPVSLSEIYTLLDQNTKKMSSSFFLAVLAELPNFIIPGITILFLFLYYQFWQGGKGGLDWNAYFVAYNLQRILSETKKAIYCSNQIYSFRQNYWKIMRF